MQAAAVPESGPRRIPPDDCKWVVAAGRKAATDFSCLSASSLQTWLTVLVVIVTSVDALKGALEHEYEAARRVVEKEFEIAREVQIRLLPAQTPEYPRRRRHQRPGMVPLERLFCAWGRLRAMAYGRVRRFGGGVMLDCVELVLQKNREQNHEETEGRRRLT
jgi:hypothetical protein